MVGYAPFSLMENSYSLDAKLGPVWHNRLGKYEFNPDGTEIFKEDWDNLVILDACRADVFSKVNRISGQSGTRQSLGSCSAEFVRGNLDGEQLHDVVIVTANAWYKKIQREGDGYEVHDLVIIEEVEENQLKCKFAEYGRRGWVLPERVTERAIMSGFQTSDCSSTITSHIPLISGRQD
jgi:hypothetical protein